MKLQRRLDALYTLPRGGSPLEWAALAGYAVAIAAGATMAIQRLPALISAPTDLVHAAGQIASGLAGLGLHPVAVTFGTVVLFTAALLVGAAQAVWEIVLGTVAGIASPLETAVSLWPGWLALGALILYHIGEDRLYRFWFWLSEDAFPLRVLHQRDIDEANGWNVPKGRQ
jgi:hypothetical protein